VYMLEFKKDKDRVPRLSPQVKQCVRVVTVNRVHVDENGFGFYKESKILCLTDNGWEGLGG